MAKNPKPETKSASTQLTHEWKLQQPLVHVPTAMLWLCKGKNKIFMIKVTTNTGYYSVTIIRNNLAKKHKLKLRIKDRHDQSKIGNRLH